MRIRGARPLLLLVLPALALTLSACDWSYFGGWHLNGGGRSSPDTGISLSNVASTTLDWTATTGGPVDSSPAVANGAVYIGSDDGKVYACNATTGATLWTATMGGAVKSTPAVDNGIVYVGSEDDKIYALETRRRARRSGPSPRLAWWTPRRSSSVRMSTSPLTAGSSTCWTR